MTQRFGWSDAVLAVLLWAAAAAGYLALVAAAPGLLTGEEASVSLRDVLFWQNRAQATVWSTNTVAPLYFWASSYLDPAFGLLSGRRWKAAALALVAPLVYAACRGRLGCTRLAAAMGALVVVALPGVAMFGWVATESGLEVVFGLGGLLAATARRWEWWPLGPVLAGIAVATYPPGVAWASAIGLCVAVNLWRARSSVAAAVVLGGALVGAGVVLAPLWWWTSGPEVIVVGGGRGDGTGGNWPALWAMLTDNGSSYYYFSELPALGSLSLLFAAAAAAIVATRYRPRQVWPYLLVAAATLVMWVPAGNLPGVRRMVALAVVAGIVLAVAVDILARRAAWAGPVVLLAAAGLLLGPLVAADASWWSSAPGRALPADWPQPSDWGRLEADLRAGADPMTVGGGDSRAAAIVVLLADRHGRGAGLDGAAVVRSSVAAALPSRG
jgi:hypothetical protein